MADYQLLPTGKPHVSFSEVKEWKDCSYRHHLHQVKKIGIDLPGIHMDFGTAMHSACEDFLTTKVMNFDVFFNKFLELWTEHKALVSDQYTDKAFEQFKQQGILTLTEFPEWMDLTFPNWKLIAAECALYEPIEKHPSHAFKGFIDAVIECDGPRSKRLVWIIDFKTCGFGWDRYKRQDEMIKSQLVLYKNYWSTKNNVDPKMIRCAFVLLKRTAKVGQRLENIVVTVGELTTKKSLTIVNNMVTTVKRGISLKNRSSCTYCQYQNTPNCT